MDDIAPPTHDAAEVVERLHHTFASNRTKPAQWRRSQLEALRSMLTAEEPELQAALNADLGKCATEAYITEIGFLRSEVDHALSHLSQWLRPRRVSSTLPLMPSRARTVREPLGVVLIISPWNYPLNLALSPLVGAIAAGNCAVLKPSELAPSVSAVLAKLLPRYLDPQAITVVEGGVTETTALLEQRFNHIFYTGNSTVARIVMTAAAKHLTPVTLELGGKSPAIVEPDVDLTTTARRLAWGKFMNAGQTCVAPDYVLAVGGCAAELESRLATAVAEMYGPRPIESPDYGRIVNERHFDRLTPLLNSGRLVTGGDTDRSQRYIAPTVLADVDNEAPAMQEEIFGPILPIVSVPDLDTAIATVKQRERPLALYAFTESKHSRRRLTTATSSGAITFGIPNAHLTVPGLPFGGVGESGMGNYHGQYSFEAFTHPKAILEKSLTPDTMAPTYPPYSRLKDRLLRRLL
ncbi:aldehyde dehydrogenase family protein [Lipingzhangella sp. LS1_29]|uniref:Aldehyde dehydrogenase n=1 Tax=Lipingzhangella rawalii TaxID=2055835 RepID=A0ABU2H4Q0_9ACTN|nr:aldehyde dehydrogenase family protein [Lipingzhangella rawalii]MDS1270271.1 aldehyde dehydrogenase family protein [Lipingzhangella rawalii]